MKILYAEEFLKQYRKLPPEIQRHFRQQQARFKQNWRDPRLHVKKLNDHPLVFSFRITRRYWVLFVFIESETALFSTIGHRRDIYRD